MLYTVESKFKWTHEPINVIFDKITIESWYYFLGLTKQEYAKQIKKIEKTIKQELFNKCPNSWDRYNIIVDLKMRDAVGIKEQQKSFLSCNVYLKKNKQMNSNPDLNFVLDVFDSVFMNTQNFTFNSQKINF